MNTNSHQLEEEKRLLEIEQNVKSLEEKIDILSTDVSDLVSARSLQVCFHYKN